jgi:hypothetical protein
MENKQPCTWGETIHKHKTHTIERKTYKARKQTYNE